MTGNNELHCNLATMLKALEFYLNHEVLKEAAWVNVHDLRYVKNNTTGDEFVVCVEPYKPKP